MGKDIPIIFSGPMVRALLDGRKTMTRRILKPPPEPFLIEGKPCEVGLLHVEGDPRPRITLGRVVTKQAVRYAVGDRLWVRENFAYVGSTDPGFLTYQATYPGDLAHLFLENVPATLKEAGYKWKPCIHMPRSLSRLTLIVTGVKVERLQDITPADAAAEGVPTHVVEHTFRKVYRDEAEREAKRLEYFAQLWVKLNGIESWNSNPFVVAISFRIIKANIDAPEARLAA